MSPLYLDADDAEGLDPSELAEREQWRRELAGVWMRRPLHLYDEAGAWGVDFDFDEPEE